MGIIGPKEPWPRHFVSQLEENVGHPTEVSQTAIDLYLEKRLFTMLRKYITPSPLLRLAAICLRSMLAAICLRSMLEVIGGCLIGGSEESGES